MVRPAAGRTELDLALPAHRVGLMRLLLGLGILYDTPAGITVSRFLQQALGAGAAYMENHVQTLFLNGQAVDCPDATIIQTDCTLALSAAMPGVFGAAFRRQGAYSGLRRRRDAEEVPDLRSGATGANATGGDATDGGAACGGGDGGDATDGGFVGGGCSGAGTADRGGAGGDAIGGYRNGGNSDGGERATVTLKCFNQVAADLGDALLVQGVSLSLAAFMQFWLCHKAVLSEECTSIRVDQRAVEPLQLSERLRGKSGPVRVTLIESLQRPEPCRSAD